MSHLPAGTVTFLFADIEGSTRKWQNWPLKMKIALKRHDEILQKTIDNSGGWVFKTVGDAIERNNDYYGPALNRVARLEALAYGGQVLMSLVTAELIRDMLP